MKISLSEKTLGQLQENYPDITWNRGTVEDWINSIALQWVAMNKTAKRMMDEDKLAEITN